MGHRVWGFVGQYLGNEDAFVKAFPIVYVDAGSHWLVPRGTDWRAGTRALVVESEEEARSLGMPLEPSPPWEVEDGDELLMAGPSYLKKLAALDISTPASQWYETGSGFRLAVESDESFSAISRDVDRQALARFWEHVNPIKAQHNVVPEAVLYALRIIGVSPTVDRLDYFAASIVLQRWFSRGSDDDLAVTTALGAGELGISAEEFEAMIDDRIAMRRAARILLLQGGRTGREAALRISRAAMGLDIITNETEFYFADDGTMGLIVDEQTLAALGV